MSELSQYDYDLPKHLIAQHPLPRRADARLLVVQKATGELIHSHIRDLAEFIGPNDCLVINETRVLPARLVGQRLASGGHWEGLYLSSDESGCWRILCKTRGKLTPGEIISVAGENGQEALQLRLLLKETDGVWIVRAMIDEPPEKLLERIGRVPLPHYIRGGEMAPSDRQRYQTVFARRPGSVAAPTAGLHFSDELLSRLEGQGTAISRVTLHVGLDTFRPITAERLADHPMHREWGELDATAADTINRVRSAGGRVIAVGTTSTRVLETAARAEEAAEQNSPPFKGGAGGGSEGHPANNVALAPWQGETDLYIHPPFEFRVLGGLLTNFHLPRTTLLVLVRTFGGDDLIRRAYEEAIREEYRFYSYGDAMLIL